MNSVMQSSKDCGFLFLTESCNLRCSHCYVSSGPDVGKHMPVEVAERALRFFAEQGIHDIRLTGGEPSIHPDFEQIIDMALDQSFGVGIVTNGSKLLQKEWATEYLPKLSRCWVSLYGTSASDDHLVSKRPKRFYAELIETVGRFTQQGNWIGLSVLLSPGNTANISTVVETAHAAGVRRLRFIPLQPDGRACGSMPTWVDWPQELHEAVCVLHSHPLTAEFELLTINDPFDLGHRFEHGGASCLLASRRMLSITPDGNIYPCCFTAYSEASVLGSVFDDTIYRRFGQYPRSGFIPKTCRGLSAQFWPGVEKINITCPIGSFDPRVAAAPHA